MRLTTHTLPAFQMTWVNPTLALNTGRASDPAGFGSNSMALLPYEAHTWAGADVVSNPRLTPVLYHRGTWQAQNRNDPEAATPTSISGRNYMYYQQYGAGYGDSGATVRTPRTILYNVSIAPAISQTDPRIANVETSFTTIQGYLDAISTDLAAKNVFAAAFNEGFIGTTNTYSQHYGFLSSAFPVSSIESDDAYTDARTYVGGDGIGGVLGAAASQVDYRRVINANSFIGGDLLVLYGLKLSSQIVSDCGPYFKSTNAAMTAFDYFGNSNARVAYDVASLAAAYARFNSYKMIVYFREDQENATTTNQSNLLITQYLTAMQSGVSAYGVEFRDAGYHDATDLSSVVQADIQTWLATLP